jgi:hypothetical protein
VDTISNDKAQPVKIKTLGPIFYKTPVAVAVVLQEQEGVSSQA